MRGFVDSHLRLESELGQRSESMFRHGKWEMTTSTSPKPRLTGRTGA